MAKQEPSAADYIKPLNMNGLQGRMLSMPAPKGRSREILMVYGHHSSLERWFGLIQVFNKFGTITMPDLPGFGGMDSFYKLGQKPSLDNLADYLAAFIKLRYKRRRITIVGMSFGFVIATRMLQRFPDLAKRVDLVVSLVGFAHKDDFLPNPKAYWSYRVVAAVFSQPIASHFFKGVCLQPFILRWVYTKLDHAKFRGLTPEEDERMLQVEIGLWRDNDVRTHMHTISSMLKLDNCTKRINLPVWHVATVNDHFLNNENIEQHLRIIFADYESTNVDMTKHAPTVIASAKEAGPFVPLKLRKRLMRRDT
jgi:pimeloyl-ACP methyl ester carboxylesterase